MVSDVTGHPEIRAIFLDIGGVLGTNGWDRPRRCRAAENFGLDIEDLDERHHLTFDTYEEGKLTLDEYLHRVVFSEKRNFSCTDIRKPDVDIYRIALDAAQVSPEKIVYIDERKMFVEIAATLGIKSIHHTNLISTQTHLKDLGLRL